MKIIKSLFLIIFLLILTGCKGDTFMEDYPQLTDKKHIYEVIDINKMFNIIDNQEDCIVVMGFKDCPWCQSLVPYLNEVGKAEGLSEIYYLDIKDMRDNKESVYHKGYLELKEYFYDAVDQEKDRINAPTVLAIKDGELAGFHLDTVSTHVMEGTILPKLTVEQEEELKGILSTLINKIK